ncbi:membrane protein of unknown function [Lactobacillus delbrueckii subsp. delbrueckii]|uniref:Major facilitator superfamily (MFS) profile domain-containing protein n=1 Tax=Lactobacillus delbrueckii subsp. delbrueckii TaxID=83684 RepID=A0AAU9R819_9LACO|nr:membrane protein of unknown function [Lactobacillus delbrueckii subsp. delbrueckii]
MKVFNQSLNNVQWITTAYLPAVTLTIVLAAYLQRSFKFKSLIIAAGTASVIGGVICMLSNTLPVMLLPRAKQCSFVGTAGMIVALAPSLGPTYGGICLAALNWRFNFIFTLPITIVF